MEVFNRKKHWENIYQNKLFENVSWYQKKPKTSLEFLKANDISPSSNIIDVGGGDSYFVDFLLDLKYENITVLDISEGAIERAKKRLGERSDKVKWIVADASSFVSDDRYDFWHDRAAFHFLTDENDIKNYVLTAQHHLNESAKMVIGTFSENGPLKCSGIEITQYSEYSMDQVFNKSFIKTDCIYEDHTTPFDTIQNFIFCTFIKK